jgi:hypothetical protein
VGHSWPVCRFRRIPAASLRSSLGNCANWRSFGGRARALSNLVLQVWKPMMAAVWARLLVLAAGWAASALIALLAGTLLDIPKLPVLLAGGGIWTCLLLILLQ